MSPALSNLPTRKVIKALESVSFSYARTKGSHAVYRNGEGRAVVVVGDIILPEFQRPLVWKRSQILELADSIYRNYPIGSMLLWETHQKLESKRTIADLEVGARSEKYPVNYLLDGQQRLSTICGMLYREPGDPRSVWNIIFDLRTQKFSHVDHTDDLSVYQVPLRRLTDPAGYFRHLASIDDADARAAADLLFNRFKDYQVPLVTLGDMSINDVAPRVRTYKFNRNPTIRSPAVGQP